MIQPIAKIPLTVAALDIEVAEMEELVRLLRKRAEHEHELATLGVNWSAKPLTRKQIISIVARRRQLRETDMLTGRTREMYEARHEAMYLMRQQTQDNGDPLWSYPQIGEPFGQDHTTAMQGIGRHAGLLATLRGSAHDAQPHGDSGTS